jgi:hypothetical protein
MMEHKMLGIGFLSLQPCLHFRVHHQVSIDASGDQHSISSVHVLKRLGDTDFYEDRQGGIFPKER